MIPSSSAKRDNSDSPSPGRQETSPGFRHPQPDRSSSTTSSAHPSKRRRVALACSTCRNRKSRCDGSRPKCSLCSELGCDCVYQQVGSSSNLTVGKDYVAQLEHRIESIEEFIRPLRQARAANEPDKAYSVQNGASYTPDDTSHCTRESDSVAHVTSQSVNPNAGEMGEVDVSENSIDGMGAIKFTDEEDCGFFGPSSNIAFMRHISRAIARGNTRNPYGPALSPYDRFGGGMMSVSRAQPTTDNLGRRRSGNAAEGVNIYALPPEARTWNLIRKYFLKTGQLLPFIHEQSFCETYFQMKRDNFTKVRRTWLGLLNIILAIATSLSTEGDLPAEKRIEESDIYYQRANGLCDRESRRNTSLEMVQYLLILGQYLQGTQKSVQAWTTHGLAVIAAFQLGLHSPDANQGFSSLEREIRKRTWFGCIMLDRTLSMTFGRPCMIPESYVKLGMPVKDMQMLGPTLQIEPGPQRDAYFFTAAIKLYVVMYNVIDKCYGQNLGFEHAPTTVHVVSQVLEGEHQLEEWRIQLLPTLGLKISHKPFTPEDAERMDPNNVIAERFNIVLLLRYHNLRILLHRKFLEKFLDAYGASDSGNEEKKLLQQVGISSVHNCVESAIMIISTVHTLASSPGWKRELLGAWNYSLYYTFNAGLVIFGALLVSSKESIHDPSQWSVVDRARPYLDIAVDALKRLDSGNRVIERCVEYLSQISVVLMALTSNGPIPNTSSGMYPPSYGPNLGATPTSQSMSNMPGRYNFNNQSPVGVDLGEFMIDSDLDFLGKLFDLNRNVVDAHGLDGAEPTDAQRGSFSVG
ncbi:transcriptional regulator family: Fungal Specific TF [Paecilomyces variotii]|nr:transcriptional regulator family: Fungal Specific TF [Paecilomyces variotii]